MVHIPLLFGMSNWPQCFWTLATFKLPWPGHLSLITRLDTRSMGSQWQPSLLHHWQPCDGKEHYPVVGGSMVYCPINSCIGSCMVYNLIGSSTNNGGDGGGTLPCSKVTGCVLSVALCWISANAKVMSLTVYKRVLRFSRVCLCSSLIHLLI